MTDHLTKLPLTRALEALVDDLERKCPSPPYSPVSEGEAHGLRYCRKKLLELLADASQQSEGRTKSVAWDEPMDGLGDGELADNLDALVRLIHTERVFIDAEPRIVGIVCRSIAETASRLRLSDPIANDPTVQAQPQDESPPSLTAAEYAKALWAEYLADEDASAEQYCARAFDAGWDARKAAEQAKSRVTDSDEWQAAVDNVARLICDTEEVSLRNEYDSLPESDKQDYRSAAYALMSGTK